LINHLRIKKMYWYMYFGALLFHSFNKFLLRPWVIENDTPQFLMVFVGSVPNFLEAIVGTSLIIGFLYFFYLRIGLKWNAKILYTIGVMISGVYVITQELKIHNLGGRNVYDFNDLIASIIGLVFIYVLVLNYGILKEDGV